jgi:monoamine oxidase
VPASVIAAGALPFRPALPDKTAAAEALPLGLANKLFLRVDMADDLPLERRVYGAVDRASTGSYHLRPFGRPLIEGYFGGALARELETQGDAAVAAFAIDELAAQLGSDIRARLTPLVVSAWSRDPFARGSYSYATPGQAAARAALAAPVDERLFFAGEAVSARDFSTAHGAYRTGVAAAEQVTQALSRRSSRDRSAPRS